MNHQGGAFVAKLFDHRLAHPAPAAYDHVSLKPGDLALHSPSPPHIQNTPLDDGAVQDGHRVKEKAHAGKNDDDGRDPAGRRDGHVITVAHGGDTDHRQPEGFKCCQILKRRQGQDAAAQDHGQGQKGVQESPR